MTPDEFQHDIEGRTPANWAGAALVTLAFLVGTLGVCFAKPIVFWIGVVILVAGMVTWKVMLGMEASSEDVA